MYVPNLGRFIQVDPIHGEKMYLHTFSCQFVKDEQTMPAATHIDFGSQKE